MKLKELLATLDNGATHLTIYDDETGEVLIRTIWYNLISKEMLDFEVMHTQSLDYELRIGVKVSE